jgi:hypothetical protein
VLITVELKRQIMHLKALLLLAKDRTFLLHASCFSAFDKLKGNSAFRTFRAGQVGDPRIAQFAVKFIF